MDSIAENKYRDPGHWLETPKVNGIKSEPEEDPGPKPEVVRGLACALLQVAQSIHQKYLKRPLGERIIHFCFELITSYGRVNHFVT